MHADTDSLFKQIREHAANLPKDDPLLASMLEFLGRYDVAPEESPPAPEPILSFDSDYTKNWTLLVTGRDGSSILGVDAEGRFYYRGELTEDTKAMRMAMMEFKDVLRGFNDTRGLQAELEAAHAELRALHDVIDDIYEMGYSDLVEGKHNDAIDRLWGRKTWNELTPAEKDARQKETKEDRHVHAA